MRIYDTSGFVILSNEITYNVKTICDKKYYKMIKSSASIMHKYTNARNTTSTCIC